MQGQQLRETLQCQSPQQPFAASLATGRLASREEASSFLPGVSLVSLCPVTGVCGVLETRVSFWKVSNSSDNCLYSLWVGEGVIRGLPDQLIGSPLGISIII